MSGAAGLGRGAWCRRGHGRGQPRGRTVGRCVAAVGLVAVLMALAPAASAVPSFDQVRAAWRPSDVPLLDRQGQVLQTLRVDTQSRRLAWVPLDEISPALLTALVHSEDRRFWEHSGVDWAGLARSAWRSALDQRTQGGSTLSMQLAGLLDADLARPAGGRSVVAKLGQITSARALEASWRKSQIIEAYLNRVPLRGELVGIGAASQTLFGKHPSGLDAQEAALLAALVRAPNARAERVAQRACGLLTAWPERRPADAALTTTPEATATPAHTATPAATKATATPLATTVATSPASAAGDSRCRGLETLAATALVRAGERPLGEQIAPHAARLAWQQWQSASPALGATPPAALPSTLDARVQRGALRALREQLAELQGREVRDGAVLVLDNASGEVRAWVGSPGGWSAAPGTARGSAPEVDAVLARRQPGSTLKPLVYELAFERRLITPASLLHDAPAQLAAGGGGLYLPQNYDKQHHGWVTARTALASSLNVPAVQVGAMLGPDALFERLNAFGLRISHSGGFHGHALALGSAEVTLADLTNAYRALANQGRWSPWRLRAGAAAAPARPVADAGAVHLVTDILADNTARALTFGFDSPLITRGFAAVKTGTSKDLRDNWCIGYTSRYTVGVWVGNASGSPMRQVSGTTGAAPVWRAVVAALHAETPSPPPAVPPGLVQAAWRTPGQAPHDEWFLAGTEPPPGPAGVMRASTEVGSSAQAGARFGIHSPVSGSLFALDPDMPAAVQRIVFDGAPGAWWLDGRLIGRSSVAQPTFAWAPMPGRHRLELRDAAGAVMQAVEFEVRGANWRGRPEVRPPGQGANDAARRDAEPRALATLRP